MLAEIKDDIKGVLSEQVKRRFIVILFLSVSFVTLFFDVRTDTPTLNAAVTNYSWIIALACIGSTMVAYVILILYTSLISRLDSTLSKYDLSHGYGPVFGTMILSYAVILSIVYFPGENVSMLEIIQNPNTLYLVTTYLFGLESLANRRYISDF